MKNRMPAEQEGEPAGASPGQGRPELPLQKLLKKRRHEDLVGAVVSRDDGARPGYTGQDRAQGCEHMFFPHEVLHNYLPVP